MPIGPLFVKYRTQTGNCYVYDPCTNEILRVGEAIYQILDDYHVLDTDEIIAKHRAGVEAVVRAALAQLDALQSRGILRDHPPQLTGRGVDSLPRSDRVARCVSAAPPPPSDS